jgi:hypothetical protein
MDAKIREFFQGIIVGQTQSYGNMTLYCLLAAQEPAVDYLTLDEALSAGELIISELHAGGSVPELKVSNRTNRRVLLLDGEELVGAKQNRVLNVTILIACHSETVIPVSCVEQRRWSYKSPGFSSESRLMSANLKRKKSETVCMSLEREGAYRSDQGLVWSEIDSKFARMQTDRSPTSALADLYESHHSRSSAYLEAFQPVERQIGMGVYINGNLAGLEFVTRFQGFRAVHRKLVQSYVMDALEPTTAPTDAEAIPSGRTISEVLDAAADAEVKFRASVALGQDIRMESPEVLAAGLAFEGQVLQLSLFPKDEETTSSRTGHVMRRASVRGRTLRRS